MSFRIGDIVQEVNPTTRTLTIVNIHEMRCGFNDENDEVVTFYGCKLLDFDRWAERGVISFEAEQLELVESTKVSV